RVAAYRRLGVDDFAGDGGGQVDGDHLAVVEHRVADVLHTVFDVVDDILQIIFFDLDLLVVLVDEHVHRVGVIGIGHFLLVKDDHFELVICLVHRLGGDTIEQVLELHLADRRVAAGLVEFSLLNLPGRAVDHHHLTGTDFLRCFHEWILDVCQAQGLFPGLYCLNIIGRGFASAVRAASHAASAADWLPDQGSSPVLAATSGHAPAGSEVVGADDATNHHNLHLGSRPARNSPNPPGRSPPLARAPRPACCRCPERPATSPDAPPPAADRYATATAVPPIAPAQRSPLP